MVVVLLGIPPVRTLVHFTTRSPPIVETVSLVPLLMLYTYHTRAGSSPLAATAGLLLSRTPARVDEVRVTFVRLELELDRQV